MGRRGMHRGYWWESQKERDHWEDLDVCVYNIMRDRREIGWRGMDWIHLAQDSDEWRTFVNTVVNLSVL
jgi:hypothetical protein